MARNYREIESLRKGLRLLRILNQFDGATAKGLADHVGVNRTTAYRLLETMRRADYVSKSPYDQRYRATARAGRLSVIVDEPGWHAEILGPALAALSRRIPWPLSIVTLEEGEVIVRHSTNADGSLMGRRMPSGSRLPLLGTAAGLLFLALASAASRDALLERAFAPWDREREYLNRFAQLQARDRDTIMAQLTEIAAARYALVQKPQSPFYSIVVPLADGERMLAALAVRLVERAATHEAAIATILPVLQDAAAAMSAALIVKSRE